MDHLISFLRQHDISFQRIDHEPLFTVDQASDALRDAPGAPTKNLFLRDDKGKRHFLVVVPDQKKVDLKKMELALASKGLGFASAERLRKYLGVEPGSVTLLALINDGEHNVEVAIDAEIWQQAQIQCHPLVNTATLIIPQADLQRFIALTGHNYRVLDVPGA